MNLNVLEIEDPCTEDWDSMIGSGDVRFCGLCRNNVYDLSAMTEDDALDLLETRDGQVCVRFYRRADGTVMTADCAPQRWAALRQRARRTITGAGVVLTTLFAAVLGGAYFGARREAPRPTSPTLAKTAAAAFDEKVYPKPEPPPPPRPPPRADHGRRRMLMGLPAPSMFRDRDRPESGNRPGSLNRPGSPNRPVSPFG